MKRLMLLVLSATLLSGPVHARAHIGPLICNASMLRVVNDGLPAIFPDVAGFPTRDLTCEGLAQVHSAVNRTTPQNIDAQRERILSLFRREGLLR